MASYKTLPALMFSSREKLGARVLKALSLFPSEKACMDQGLSKCVSVINEEDAAHLTVAWRDSSGNNCHYIVAGIGLSSKLTIH